MLGKGPTPSPALHHAFLNLRELKVNVVNPLLLELYGDHEANLLRKKRAAGGPRVAGVLRVPPGGLRHPVELPAENLRNLYKFNKSCSYWLRKLENHQRKEPIAVANYTLEHILPQNPELPPPWRQALGENWKALQEEWLHRLGNLTLTGYNPELSDRPFLEKRDHEGGFATSPLQLNAGLGQLDSWGVDQIQERGSRLAERALAVWAAPSLPHEQLANPQIRALFDALDLSIRALDPNVYQEVLKLYIAYKCKTNFVDIVPQAKSLRLSLNMPFAELDDRKGLARDITSVGCWGNGDVELRVSTLEEVPYAIGLIRQSLERQLEAET